MRQPSLDEEYQALVREGFANGELSVRSDGPDNRVEPRFTRIVGGIGVRVEPEFRLVDLSATGIAFYSELPFAVGSMLHIVLRHTVAFQARVVGVQLVETDSVLMEARYRVQCRFSDPTEGKQLLVLLKEMERLGDLRPVN